MTGRPLHALLLPPDRAGRLLEALAAALDGSGPAILPLDPDLPPARIAALCEAFEPAVVETVDGASRWRPAGRRAGVPAGDRGEVPPEVAVVIATSGSAGQPKGAQLSAGALLHSARASLARIGARPGERWLCPLPTSHIAGLGVLVRSLVSGTDPVVTRHLGAAGTDLAALRCSHVSLVPAQLRRLLAARASLATFGTILLGGAAVPAALLASARAAGARVVTTYGMSETCGGCVYDGVALDAVSVRAGTGDGDARGSAGRIKIAGPVVFSGYRGRPGLTAQATSGRWFITSDVGRVDETGRLTVLGRADEMINTGGHKVAPAEVSAALEGFSGVREAAVTGEPDPEWGQRVTAFVVPADPDAPPGLDELREHARKWLPGYALPKAMVLLDEMPLLPSGKPDLSVLRCLLRG